MTLDQLLLRARISQFHAVQWFAGAKLADGVLYVTDPDVAAMLARCFKASFEQILGAPLTIAVAAPVAAPKSRVPLLKKAYRGETMGPRQGDLL